MDWQAPPDDFKYILFERIEPGQNVFRFYYLAWQQPALLDTGAVVRVYGRKHRAQQQVSPIHFTSLEAAWPLIRSLIKTHLRHGYRITQPQQFCPFNEE